MWIGRVVGSVWSTVRHAPLEGFRFVLVEREEGPAPPEAAVDTVGAGPGDRVLVITAYEATLPLREMRPGMDLAGADAAVVAILDCAGDAAEAQP